VYRSERTREETQLRNSALSRSHVKDEVVVVPLVVDAVRKFALSEMFRRRDRLFTFTLTARLNVHAAIDADSVLFAHANFVLFAHERKDLIMKSEDQS
jgi:hypothetical protein